jgi:hypothetical protein
MRGKLDLHGLEKYDPIAVRSEYTEEELEEFTFKTMCKVGRWGAWRMRLGREERERRREGERVRGKEGKREREKENGHVILCAVRVRGEYVACRTL